MNRRGFLDALLAFALTWAWLKLPIKQRTTEVLAPILTPPPGTVRWTGWTTEPGPPRVLTEDMLIKTRDRILATGGANGLKSRHPSEPL